MQTPPLSASAGEHVVGHVARVVADRPRRGVGEDRPATVETSSAWRITSALTWLRSTSIPIRFISRDDLAAELGEPAAAPARRWPSRPRGRCRCASGSGSATPEPVQHPQRAERLVDLVAALGPHQAGDPALLPRALDVLDRASPGRAGRRTARIMACAASTCSRVAVTAASPVQRRRARTPTRTAPPLPRPAAAAGRCAVPMRLAGLAVGQLQPVEVVADLLPRRPQQVVVPVEDRVLAQQGAIRSHVRSRVVTVRPSPRSGRRSASTAAASGPSWTRPSSTASRSSSNGTQSTSISASSACSSKSPRSACESPVAR